MLEKSIFTWRDLATLDSLHDSVGLGREWRMSDRRKELVAQRDATQKTKEK